MVGEGVQGGWGRRVFPAHEAINELSRLNIRIMSEIVVYKSEMAAGIADKVCSQTTVAGFAQARLSKNVVVPKNLRRPAMATASKNDADVQPIDAVLVSTGTNKNDDHFDRVEVWNARRTPEHKMLNYQHDDSRIVGHVISSTAVDTDLKEIADDSVIDDLPSKFHLVTSGVLYTQWATQKLQQQMDEILAAIAKGELAVSMECSFLSFDFLMTSPDGSTKVVARNEATAFLTKHLASYGGTGKFGNEKVARLLRAVTFTGKGLVANPANPDSVILQPSVETAIAEYLEGRGQASVQEPSLMPAPNTVAAHIFDYLTKR
jgi:hypothetical protein